MKVLDLIANLQALAVEYGNLDVIYSKDDEGNAYKHIYYTPTAYEYRDSDDVTSAEQAEEDGEDFTPNAICVN